MFLNKVPASIQIVFFKLGFSVEKQSALKMCEIINYAGIFFPCNFVVNLRPASVKRMFNVFSFIKKSQSDFHLKSQRIFLAPKIMGR